MIEDNMTRMLILLLHFMRLSERVIAYFVCIEKLIEW